MTTKNGKFLQIHTLTSYPAALLNRDDIGFAKRMPFGGASRTRISSQCLKRHWRRFEGENALSEIAGERMSVRSRRTFVDMIRKPLVDDHGMDEERAREVTQALVSEVLQINEKRAAAKEKEEDGKKAEEDLDKPLLTGQVVVLGKPEVDFFLKEAREVAESDAADAKALKAAFKERFKRDGKKNLFTLLDAGLDCAMFGRMVTSDVLSRCDAALHVAHAFTVHAEDVEEDYFSAADDLAQEAGETGSGHINSTELTSGLYYSYVVVDLPLLVSNLTGCKQEDWHSADHALAKQVVERMVKLIATVSPGAKLGSTAPYAYAHMMLVESGSQTPRTLANAFMKPVRAPEGELLPATYDALAAHLKDLDTVYDAPDGSRQGLALGDPSAFDGLVPEFGSLNALSQWAADQVSA